MPRRSPSPLAPPRSLGAASHAATLSLGAMALLGACLPAPPPGGRSREVLPVLHGDPDDEHDGTVMLQGWRAECSGSLIAPALVLTANHCLSGSEADGWAVGYGRRPVWDPELMGREIYSPGRFEDMEAQDVALLSLRAPVPAPTYVAAVDVEDDLVGSEVTIVGYGLNEEERSGTRLRGTLVVTEVTFNWLVLEGEQLAGNGDSGGSIIDARGQVIGVTSGGSPGVTYAVRVDAYRELIDPVLRAERGCIPGEPEQCDGFDNNCDGLVDEVCFDAFEACETSELCTTGLCADGGDGAICTWPCPPGDHESCGEGAHCREVSCGHGVCVAGTAGSGGRGASCERDEECASLLCTSFEGASRCAERCVVNQMDCDARSICVATDGECGICMDADEADQPRGLGEPCGGDEGCASGLCVDAGYCTVPCSLDEPCPDGSHCRQGACRLGEPGALGALCVGNEDCASGPCGAVAGPASVCTEECGAGNPCPSGWSCDFDAGLCRTSAAPLGESCAGAECLEGECVEMAGERRCARPCETFCPEGLRCIDGPEGSSICWPDDGAGAESACACAAAGARPPRRAGRGALGTVLDLML